MSLRYIKKRSASRIYALRAQGGPFQAGSANVGARDVVRFLPEAKRPPNCGGLVGSRQRVA